MQFAANHWNPVGHFYVPIAFYGGTILKYHGIATEGNRDWMQEKHAGLVILDAHKGDRIRADDHSEYTAH